MIEWIGIVGLLLQVIAQPAPPLSVSEVVNNSAKYGGHAVIVTGELQSGEEFTGLFGQGCEKRLNLINRPYNCALSLGFLDYDEASRTQEFKDILAITRMNRHPRSQRIVTVSLVGLVVLPTKVFVPSLSAVPALSEGGYVEQGFGHMNAFPLKLVVLDGRIIADSKVDAKQDR